MTFRKYNLPACFALVLLIISGCDRQPTETQLPYAEFIQVTEDLSTDAMTGRETGTKGNAAARAYLIEKISSMGLAPFVVNADGAVKLTEPGSGYTQQFKRSRTSDAGEVAELVDGVNILFAVPGTRDVAKNIVISAHYDHVGVVDGKIYNGADDNASGVAGLLAIAKNFQESPPDNTIIFALFDAEEGDHSGAEEFVNVYGESLDIALNINLDMISRSDVNELYVAGTYHQPHWVPFFEQLADRVPVSLLMGHDDPALGEADDWTFQSDHREFHEQGIPFVYFGVEDHADFHQPTDTFDRIPQAFFSRSIESIVIAAETIDASLDALLLAQS